MNFRRRDRRQRQIDAAEIHSEKVLSRLQWACGRACPVKSRPCTVVFEGFKGFEKVWCGVNGFRVLGKNMLLRSECVERASAAFTRQGRCSPVAKEF